MKTIIGITGKIGAGKSTAITHLDKHSGVHVFDCDGVAHRLYNDPDVQKQLQDKFNTASRDDIRALIKQNQSTWDIQQLNHIFARPLHTKYVEWANKHQGLLIIDAPLLFETGGMLLACDHTIQISSTFSNRSQRVKDRSPKSSEIFGILDANQKSDEYREKHAEYIVHNNGTIDELLTELDTIIYPFLPSMAMYAGSFDPFTKGHLNIVEKAAKIFDMVYVAVGNNPDKHHTLLPRTRLDIIAAETQHIPNIEIVCYHDMLLTAAHRFDCTHLIRGIRNSADAITEMNMHGIHAFADQSIQTIFIPADPKYAFISSSAAKTLTKSYLAHNPQDIVDVSWMISDNTRLELTKAMIREYNTVTTTG